jgi:hypothetical protein
MVDYEIDSTETDEITFLLKTEVSDIPVEEQPGANEPDFQLELKIETRGDKVVLHPVVIFPMFGAGMGLNHISYDLMGNTGYPIELETLTFKNM